MEIALKPATGTDLERQVQCILGLRGDNYEHHIKDFCRWLSDNTDRLDRQAIIDYFSYLQTTNYRNGTKVIKRAAVKKRIRQLAEIGGLDGELQDNLETFLKRLDTETATRIPTRKNKTVDRDKYLLRDDVKKLLQHSKGDRQNLIIKFLWATGCRVSEMLGIKFATDCKLDGEIVNLRIVGKRNDERWVKVSYGLYSEIRTVFSGVQYLFETKNGKPYTRSGVSDQLAKLSKRILGKAYRAHAYRHSFASQQIREGTPLPYVSKYMGHSSLAITADLYTHGQIETRDLISNEL